MINMTSSSAKKIVMICATLAAAAAWGSGFFAGKTYQGNLNNDECVKELASMWKEKAEQASARAMGVDPTDENLEYIYGDEGNKPVDPSIHIYDFEHGQWQEKRAL